MITIQIITYNSAKVIERCLASLELLHLSEYEIIIIDNASTDGTPELLEQLKKTYINLVVVLNTKNVGFGKAHNQAAALAQGDTLLILNPDTVVLQEDTQGYMQQLSQAMTGNVYGFLFANTDKTTQATIGAFPTLVNVLCDRLPLLKQNRGMVLRDPKHYQTKHRVDWVCGCGILITKKDFLQVGGFNEKYFLYCEEIELCKNLADTGIAIWYDPHISFMHFKESREGDRRSQKYHHVRRGLMLYFQTHRSLLEYTLLRIVIKLEGFILRKGPSTAQ